AVMSSAWDGRAVRTNGPAGATVADGGVTASSGARCNGARSPCSPGAPPYTPSDVHTSGTPVCAAVGGPVRAVAATPSPLDGPRLTLGCQATCWPPVGAATRSNRHCALPLRSAPERHSGRHRRRSALPVPLVLLSPQAPLTGGCVHRCAGASLLM